MMRRYQLWNHVNRRHNCPSKMQSGVKSATHRLTCTKNIGRGAGRHCFNRRNRPDYNPKLCKLMGFVTLEMETAPRRTREDLPRSRKGSKMTEESGVKHLTFITQMGLADAAWLQQRQPSEERINQRRHNTSQPSAAAEDDASTRKTLWMAVVPRLDCFQSISAIKS